MKNFDAHAVHVQGALTQADASRWITFAIRALMSGGLAFILNGCGLAREFLVTSKSTLSAKPLAYHGHPLTAQENEEELYSKKGEDALRALAVLRVDSITKCQDFLETLTIARGGANYASDTTISLLSAAAALTTPISVAHALAGGATVIGASKSSYNSEFFDNANTAALMQIIVQSYYQDLSSFDDGLRLYAASPSAVSSAPQTSDSADSARSAASASSLATSSSSAPPEAQNTASARAKKLANDLSFADQIDRLYAVHSNCSLIYARATQSATVQAAIAKNQSAAKAAAEAASAAEAAAAASAASPAPSKAASSAGPSTSASAPLTVAPASAPVVIDATATALRQKPILPGSAFQDR